MISIIIPALNEEETILNCLRSLTAQSIPRKEYEIIVVDGGSSDNTRAIAETLADQVISQKRAGIGGARGDGAGAAHGTILVFTDADTRYPTDWLETIRERLTTGRYDVCTGPVRFYNKTIRSCIIQGWRQSYLLLHPFGFYWLIGSNFAVTKKSIVRQAATGTYPFLRITTSPYALRMPVPGAPMTAAPPSSPRHAG
jgi:glycosyltransferase involved in cell wall biosynthesis